MRILVTGTAALIGNALAPMLRERDDEVIAVDNPSDYYHVGLKGFLSILAGRPLEVFNHNRQRI